MERVGPNSRSNVGKPYGTDFAGQFQFLEVSTKNSSLGPRREGLCERSSWRPLAARSMFPGIELTDSNG
ncbi:hypothetical protein GCG54_00009720 [Colletotrichum gloeosporioides]|uniref:Uncharacterized protein n=1 Tax=Colletotrichum gloeosporioides TaxID=474922 RepID=A0A8H4CFD0_COLGL|nr:uncharacterized protein GCG54_00009720 [Colletotrichum gloeosporioides]KAF3803025.1 hypothetical protein GCG54_00009720 [Colletotrichum gloeosporioides]